MDGVYRLYLEGWGFANVYCDMTNGGWILFQRNLFPGTNFFRKNWESFKTGFGDLTQSFWMGNGLLHFISKKMGSMEFFVQLLDIDGVTTGNAYFTGFTIASESDGYRFDVTGYDASWSNAGDSIVGVDDAHTMNRMKFSTYDRDQDLSPISCAGPGFWWSHCGVVRLNDRYGTGSLLYQAWYNQGYRQVIKTELKIR